MSRHSRPSPPRHPPTSRPRCRDRGAHRWPRRVGALALTACTNSSSTAAEQHAATAARPAPPTRPPRSGSAGGAESGEKIKIGFSAPAADHGWMGSITKSAVAEAEALGDVDLVVAEGTNDVNLQISQVETFINDKVDAIVLLPFDGAAMTDVAIEGDERRDPGDQRRPGVRQPVRRPRRRSWATTTAWACRPAPTSANSSATSPTR